MIPKQLDNEGPRPYAAFTEYCEQGPQRSVREVARKLHKSSTLMGRWSKKFRWPKRAKQYDQSLQEQKNAAEETAVQKISTEIVQRREQTQQTAWDWAQKLFVKAGAMLDFPLSQRVIEYHPDGKEKIVINPMSWRISDMARLVELADTLSRLATDMHTGKGMPGAGENLPFLTPETVGLPPLVIQFTTNEETEKAIAEFGERPARLIERTA